jgi:sugar phosphate isomerase/epimerase
MILGLASPTYSGQLPAEQPLLWLLERCVEYNLQALEASLPLNGADDPAEVGKKAADLGITWVGYWSDDFVTPEGRGAGLRERAEIAFDIAVTCGVKTVVIFGAGSRHNRFTKEPPLHEQLKRLTEHLRPVAEAASERGLQLGLLPHLDYRGHEMVSVMETVSHPALKMAFDTTNPFPVCEEPVDAAKVVLPHTVAVALKDVRVYPHRSNDVTIWGTPIGQGSVDFDTILPMLRECLPDPDNTTVCIKLRLPPGSTEHLAWMEESLEFLRSYGV